MGMAQENTLTAFVNERLWEIEEVDRERRREVELGRLPREVYEEGRRERGRVRAGYEGSRWRPSGVQTSGSPI
jgi:hypothetical protein